MKNFLKNLLRVSTTDPGPEDSRSSILPDAPFFAVGDIHGRLDLMHALLKKIDPLGDQSIVFLGDYVDRGPDSAGVLNALFLLQAARPSEVICLMGNHERMMLDFLDDPLGRGARWLRNGGLETLASFGISAVSDRPDADAAIALCDALDRALPEGLSDWLRGLPYQWHCGNIWCVHAGMNPRTSPAVQTSGTLLWGHKDCAAIQRTDGVIVVHGHTIVPTPRFTQGRIAIDTGAYRTGTLAAARIAQGCCDFMTVSEQDLIAILS